MRQEIQVSQPPEQLLNDAASFFSKRRATITDRDARGFRFTIGGADGGQLTADPAGVGSKVTVQADGLGVLAIAEGYVRDLRKSAKGAGRQGRSAGGAGVGGGFGDLRQRLGMPAPPPPRPRPAPQPEAGPPTAAAQPLAEVAQPEVPKMTEQAIKREGDGSEHLAASGDRAVHPDGPAPNEAHAVHPASGPQGAPPAGPASPPSHPAFLGPEGQGARAAAAASEPSAAEAPARPADALANEPPSAEQLGGVPTREEVKVEGETPTPAVASGAGYAETPPPTSAEKP